MAQRTIAEATFALECLSGLSDVDRRAFEAEIKAAKAEATASAETIMDGRVNEVAEARDEALAELCEIRDAYEALVGQAQLGRTTAADYESNLNELRSRQRSAERHLGRTEEALAFIETVEADPTSYGEQLFNKYPLIRPNFSF